MPIEANSSLGGARAYARQISEAPVRTRHSLCEQYSPPWLAPENSPYVKRRIMREEAIIERRSVIFHREHMLTACAYTSMIHHAPADNLARFTNVCIFVYTYMINLAEARRSHVADYNNTRSCHRCARRDSRGSRSTRA